jgi:GxxExxY protein
LVLGGNCRVVVARKAMTNRQDSKHAKREFPEPSAQLDELARRVIGAAIEVHRELGPGFLESVYEEALAVEMQLRQIPAEQQARVRVLYKGHEAGEARVDFLVAGALVVELKAVEAVVPIHRTQVISYLKALRTPLGLLLNFRASTMRQGIERIVWSPWLRSEPQHRASDVEEGGVAAQVLS